MIERLKIVMFLELYHRYYALFYINDIIYKNEKR